MKKIIGYMMFFVLVTSILGIGVDGGSIESFIVSGFVVGYVGLMFYFMFA